MKSTDFKPKLALTFDVLFLCLSFLIPILFSIAWMVLGLADQTAKFVSQKYPLDLFKQSVFFVAIFFLIYAVIGFVIFLVKNFMYRVTGLKKEIFGSFLFNKASVLSMIPVVRKLVKTTSLREYDAALYARLQDWAKTSGNEIEGIQVLHTKKYSSEANAFFLGLGRSPKMTLVDSLFDHYTPSEIEAIIAHEFGHKHDPFNSWSTVLLRIIGALAIIGWGIWKIVSSGSAVSIPFTIILVNLYWLFTMIFNNGVSKYRELTADTYAILHIQDVDVSRA
jgi:Zn-dependent protease with chaperone function